MYNTYIKPIKVVEPTKCVSRSVSSSGIFKKKITDNEGNNFFIEINVNKKTGTITKYLDEEFKTSCNKMDLKKLEGADKLFEEAEYKYEGINIQLM